MACGWAFMYARAMTTTRRATAALRLTPQIRMRTQPSTDSSGLKCCRAMGQLTKYGLTAVASFPSQILLTEYAPRAMVFQSSAATIRWGGNEAGYVPYPSWNAVDREILQKGTATAADSKPDGNAWAPLEADTTLYEAAWFWSEAKSQTAKSVEQLMEIYYKTVGHGAVLLLNAAPDTSGRIPTADVKIYKQFGEELQRRFANPAAETTNVQGHQIELDLGAATAIDHAITMEDYREGERIREYRIEGQLDGSKENWVVLASGSAVGRMKIDRFAKQTVHKARLVIEKSVCEPLIRKFAVYCLDSGKIRIVGEQFFCARIPLLGHKNQGYDFVTKRLFKLYFFCIHKKDRLEPKASYRKKLQKHQDIFY